MGQQLVIDENNYKVTGVLADVPENSHLQYEALISINTVTREQPEFNDRWGSNFMVTYLLLAPQTNITRLEAKFPQFLRSHMNEEGASFYTLFLQELSDVHLGSMNIEHDYQNYRKFDGTYINTFSILALFVLIIASINFMNLSVARSTTRSKEVGIRKAIGALKQQLVGQFLGESVLLTLIALALSILLASAFLPYLNSITDRSLSLSTIFNHADAVIGMLLIVSLVGVLSGFYPAFFLSSFQPAKVLKGKLSGLNRKSLLRSGLVVVQFATAIALIVGTVLATRQLNFMKDKDVGFNREQMLLIPHEWNGQRAVRNHQKRAARASGNSRSDRFGAAHRQQLPPNRGEDENRHQPAGTHYLAGKCRLRLPGGVRYSVAAGSRFLQRLR